MPGIQRLIAVSESDEREQEKVSSGEVEGLLRSWTMWNFVRAGCAAVGGLVSVYALSGGRV